jgi:drug/metabolite transporter (DMT)-like permease
LAITWYSQMVGGLSITLIALLVPAERVVAADWGWGALGGLAGATGLVLLYGALAAGPMAVVAPVTAVVSAIVPVVYGVIDGERPKAVALVGILFALPAIVLVAGGGTDGDGARIAPRVLVQSLCSGLGFGFFFVFFASAGEDAGLWPTVGARVASVGALALVVLIRMVRHRTRSGDEPSGLRVAPASIPLIAGAGVLDVGANAVYLVASRMGLLSLISVVSAMYPAATVALARLGLHERLARQQIVGLLLAAVAVGLVAYGRG